MIQSLHMESQERKETTREQKFGDLGTHIIPFRSFCILHSGKLERLANFYKGNNSTYIHRMHTSTEMHQRKCINGVLFYDGQSGMEPGFDLELDLDLDLDLECGDHDEGQGH